MGRNIIRAIACVVALSLSGAASAVTIQVQVVDTSHINVWLSGSLVGPAPPSNLGILYIDSPVPGSILSNGTSITGDAMLGSNSLYSAYSGYNNPPYDGTLQLRNSLNGSVAMSIGDVLSGSASIAFNSNHGMTQSMFDGSGVPIYWGSDFPNRAVGTLQGYAVSYVPVATPEPPVWSLLCIALLGAIGTRRLGRQSLRRL